MFFNRCVLQFKNCYSAKHKDRTKCLDKITFVEENIITIEKCFYRQEILPYSAVNHQR